MGLNECSSNSCMEVGNLITKLKYDTFRIKLNLSLTEF